MGRVALGVVARTGSATLVALTETAGLPALAGRWEIDLGLTGLPVQPYHAAAGLPLLAAERLVAEVEATAERLGDVGPEGCSRRPSGR